MPDSKKPQRSKAPHAAPSGGDSNPTDDKSAGNAPAATGFPKRGDQESEWKEKVIQIRRVTKVVKGGKKLSFRAVVVVGNGKGQVGLGIGKSNEVIGAIQKGVTEAMKNLVEVPLFNKTIPHPVEVKLGGVRLIVRPASDGTGVIAGGAARSVLELAGIENVLSKSRGKSPLNVASATLQALRELRSFKQVAEARGLTVKQMLTA